MRSVSKFEADLNRLAKRWSLYCDNIQKGFQLNSGNRDSSFAKWWFNKTVQPLPQLQKIKFSTKMIKSVIVKTCNDPF